jgi:hypothetical protein
VHGPVPEHAPPQPTKIESGAADAVTVTVVPGWNGPPQNGGGEPGDIVQNVPVGWISTVPPPPSMLKGSTAKNRGPRNSADTNDSCVIVIVQVPVPEHRPPPQPTEDRVGRGRRRERHRRSCLERR